MRRDVSWSTGLKLDWQGMDFAAVAAKIVGVVVKVLGLILIPIAVSLARTNSEVLSIAVSPDDVAEMMPWRCDCDMSTCIFSFPFPLMPNAKPADIVLLRLAYQPCGTSIFLR